jgi:hypothetical protein
MTDWFARPALFGKVEGLIENLLTALVETARIESPAVQEQPAGQNLRWYAVLDQ